MKNENQKSKLRWLVVNITRGLFDGHYSTQAGAEHSAQGWVETYPDDRIVVCQIAAEMSGEHVHRGLPDHNWMANDARGVWATKYAPKAAPKVEGGRPVDVIERVASQGWPPDGEVVQRMRPMVEAVMGGKQAKVVRDNAGQIVGFEVVAIDKDQK